MKCSTCQTELNPGNPVCSVCGTENIFKHFEELIGVSDSDRDITARNIEGELEKETRTRERGFTTTGVYSEKDKPTSYEATRSRPHDDSSDEESAAQAFAKALNSKQGSSYTVKAKDSKDKNKFPDRVLESPVAGEPSLEVEITHLDSEAIRNLQTIRTHKGTVDLIEFHERICHAIRKKSIKYSVGTKAATYLLLEIPISLGVMLRHSIQRLSFDLCGFKEIWICPLGEDSFQLFTEIPREYLAVAAYYIWQKEGPYWGNDHCHWYQAIDEVRGLNRK